MSKKFLFFECPVCGNHKIAFFFHKKYQCKKCKNIIIVKSNRCTIIETSIITPLWFFLFWCFAAIFEKKINNHGVAEFLGMLISTIILVPLHIGIRPYFVELISEKLD